MRVLVYAWYGQPLPLGLSAGPQNVEEDILMKLFEQGHDVMFLHKGEATKKKRVSDPDDLPLLAISPKYMGFKQR